MAIRLLLTGGGTGGHLFPAIAVAREFQRQYPDTKTMFIGTKRRMDTESLRSSGFESRAITSFGIKGKSPLQLLKAFASLPQGYWEALRILREFRPDVVFAVGGYVTGPVVAAAKSLRIPVVLHEQNSVPGLANRYLSRIADRICLSLTVAEGYFNAKKTVFTGNPVRENILALAAERRTTDEKTILVLGGSQGAHRLNVLVPEALRTLKGKFDLKVIHQTGKNDVEEVRASWQAAGIDAVVEPFFRDMAKVYRQASLVISRAGATTLAELAVTGMPAVLIPYPFAADNHQLKNAEHYVAGGGAVVFEEAGLNAEILGSAVQTLFAENRLEEMGAMMKKLAVPDAADRIVKECLNLAGGRQ
jgi:UDP-N-acetylglucosamine--N-acetylmuramyl-(pentapeptide) pyrophosphoryl-undecaprenol N-acetylglucosamine transferase